MSHPLQRLQANQLPIFPGILARDFNGILLRFFGLIFHT
jgi:hypothetical protein